jgi:hypothetical protein
LAIEEGTGGLDIDPAFYTNSVSVNSELILTTSVMYESSQLGSKKIPFTGQLFVFQDYLVFVEKSKMPGFLNKDEKKLEVKLKYMDIANCILESHRLLQINLVVTMKNYHN